MGNQANSKGSGEEINVNWRIQKRDKDLQDWKTYKKSRIQENNEDRSKSTDTFVTNCINVLVKYSNYNLQEKIDHIEEMENSRKICIAALIRKKEELKHQPSREIVNILITQLENK